MTEPRTFPSAADKRRVFFDLHARPEVFIMPNPWDVGSARLLAHAGFPALATTSAGFAWSLGMDDYAGVTLDALVEHVAAVAAVIPVPLNVDSERCFAETPDGVAATVRLLHEAGAAGCSIEDYNPSTDAIDPLEVSAERVAAAAEAAHRGDDRLLLTARCENFLHGITDLNATIDRLIAYRDAGADCVYAPGLTTVAQIRAVVDAVGVPVNVLLWPGAVSAIEIGEAGGRRVSLGSSVAGTAYGAAMVAARELLDTGTCTFLSTRLQPADRVALQR